MAFVAAGIDATIPREHEGHVVTERGERLRQRRGDLSEPASLRKRMRLGRDHQDRQTIAFGLRDLRFRSRERALRDRFDDGGGHCRHL